MSFEPECDYDGAVGQALYAPTANKHLQIPNVTHLAIVLLGVVLDG